MTPNRWGEGAGSPDPEWSVAILSSREKPVVLLDAIRAAVCACRSRPTVLDVVINGNIALAEAIKDRLRAEVLLSPDKIVRVWAIQIADKPHAWNEYVHKLWPKTRLAFFVDGYAKVQSDAFELLAEGLASHPAAVLASGVPTVGRSARRMREAMRGGGIHGNLFAIRGSAMEEIRQCGFRLPLGMYRTDGTILSALCFRMDPQRYEWDWNRVFVHPRATWTFQPLSWWRPSDVRAYLKRILRQSQGHLISRAVKAHLALERRAPAALPRTVSHLVLGWAARYPKDVVMSFLRDPIAPFALRSFRQEKDWSKTAVAPDLVTIHHA